VRTPTRVRGDLPEPPSAGRPTVRSVARALEAVRVVEAGPPEGVTLTALSQHLGMSKSSTLATLRTLAQAGFLRETQPGPRYKLGMALIRLGDLTARQQLPGDLTRPILRDLSERTGMTARLAIADGGFPVFVERVDGPGAVRFHTPLGSRELPHSTAAGKAILAELPEGEVESICGDRQLVRRTDRTITDPNALLSELRRIQRRGYSLDNEEDAEGIFCAGSAFHYYGGIAAVSVTGIKGDITQAGMREVGETVRVHAQRLAKLLAG